MSGILSYFFKSFYMNWQNTNLIWLPSILRSLNAKGLPEDPIKFYSTEHEFNPSLYLNIQKGDILYIRGKHIKLLIDKILSNVKELIVLIVAGGDESFPSNCNVSLTKLSEHPAIGHIFAQNYDGSDIYIDNNFVTPIPIYLDFHTVAYRNGGWCEPQMMPKDQEKLLNTIVSHSKPARCRILKAFVDFHHSDTMNGGEYNRSNDTGETRTEIFQKLKVTGCIDYGDFMKRSDLWKKKTEYAFSIAPHGAGLCTHRVWEDLVLGCIVIVKTSTIDPLYKDLPVVIIKDWSEITSKNLNFWLEKYNSDINAPHKLQNDYWINKIKTTTISRCNNVM